VALADWHISQMIDILKQHNSELLHISYLLLSACASLVVLSPRNNCLGLTAAGIGFVSAGASIFISFYFKSRLIDIIPTIDIKDPLKFPKLPDKELTQYSHGQLYLIFISLGFVLISLILSRIKRNLELDKCI
jgi:hypothetical protein